MTSDDEASQQAGVRQGTRLGPYEIVAPVGTGGMGEVYRARDTRLGRDVAIKVLPTEFATDPERLGRFEQEARAAAAVNHPNILVLFDVGRHEGQPYLVTELLEGETLRDQIARGGLTVSRSVELGIQIAKGLAAAHEKGIVHRDLKPGNVFVTSDGTVKLLDFGLAKLTQPVSGEGEPGGGAPSGTDTASGLAVGTVGYMAPEQIRLQAVDHRADIFAFGCVLYEMLSRRRAFQGETPADTMSAILTKDPEPLSGAIERLPAALDQIVRRCLEKRPADRFGSARDLGFALQAVVDSMPREAVQRLEEIRPYPGLAAFTEADAERFFGRDEELGALWRTLPERPLLALIGPSGAGKTSFLRAGVIPQAPAGWRCVVAAPGRAPFAALARALVPEFAGDLEATGRLFQLHEPDVAAEVFGQWKSRCDHGLVVVDQFEELFTLNGEKVQAEFAGLLGTIASLGGIHVLLSMRDDFFFQCSGHEALSGVFSSATPLRPLSREGLADALVKPAMTFGYAFEDDGLVEEMVQAVVGERGALPLLAFSVARLWDERDRDTKLLTRQAYERLGGVGGALAQHAEATLERIGGERQAIVREIFRNLVTAEQTRCLLDADELLSVFPQQQRSDARQVLERLVEARLLTSFEEEGSDGRHRQRVEVVHESLLTAWPRLVRWQAQYAEGALLRDQLRQAARLWEEKGRPEELLWTGTSCQEYQDWRARYPGGLSELETSFGQAMTDLAGRRRRRRRVAYAAVLLLLVAVLVVVGSFWRRSVQETRRVEAAHVLALGRLQLAENPNVALAYATASLETADNEPARRFAVETLWQGPTALLLTDPIATNRVRWSPDGHWLALCSTLGVALVGSRPDQRVQIANLAEPPVGFSEDGARLVTRTYSVGRSVFHVWARPDWRLERTLELPEEVVPFLAGNSLLTFAFDQSGGNGTRFAVNWKARRAGGPQGDRAAVVRRLRLDGKSAETLGTWAPHGLEDLEVDPGGAWVASIQNGVVLQQRIDALAAPPRVLGRHDGGVGWAWAGRESLASGDRGGNILLWDLRSGRLERELKSPAGAMLIALDPRGRYLATGPGAGAMISRSMFLFDLEAPRSAEPVPLLNRELTSLLEMAFSPDGSWLASSHAGLGVLWNLKGARSTVVGRHPGGQTTVSFVPDRRLVSAADDGVVRLWPLSASSGEGVRELWSRPGTTVGGWLPVDQESRFAVVVERAGRPWRLFVVPLDGSPPVEYKPMGSPDTAGGAASPTLDPGGRNVAVTHVEFGNPAATSIRVFDLSTGAERVLDTHAVGEDGCEPRGTLREGIATPLWLPDGRLLTDGDAGFRRWDLAAGTSEQLRPCRKMGADESIALLATPGSKMVVRLDLATKTGEDSTVTVFDLTTRETRSLASHSNRVRSLALDLSGATLVTGDLDGTVRVGPLTGEEPHLLFGHAAAVTSVAVSPDGRWIASAGDDGTIRLWPMPDLSKPPLHTWPREELLAKLKSLTNLRAVRDPSSDTGWKIEVGPFPGWATVPDWQP